MKIAAVSQSRSDFGIYLPLLKAIPKDDLTIILDGMHFAKGHGDTFLEVERTFPGQCLVSLITLDFDWLIVLGDTWPMLEYTIKAVKQGIPVAHIHGGDLTGSVDDSIRHAITKLANLHFPSLPEHEDRLVKMGEEQWRITTVGPLGIYAMPDAMYSPDIKKELGLNEKPIILVIQHPVASEAKEAGQQMKETLEAVNNPDWQPVIIYPNSDPGADDMIKVIKNYPYKSFKSLPYLQFLSLLRASYCIVGNSSCGLVEAPLFKIPCVNIGDRQSGRTGTSNTLCVVYFMYELIRYAIDVALRRDVMYSNPYLGYTNGPELILNKLYNTPIDKKLFEKKLTY
jgi:GDP/UDP-N,N'-diacetylbacillosamine 2-epimerase (hydrolysing)